MIKLLTTTWRQRAFAALAAALLLCIAPALAQTVSGTVTDERDESLIGVNIVQRGTTLGTLTDIDGNFSLTIPGATGRVQLVISYIGYGTQTIDVDFSSNPNQQLDIQLRPDVMNLDEVVVTGASAATSRRQLGNAISTLGEESLTKTGTSNIVGMLSGKVMGALVQQNSGDPGGGVSIRLRGSSTIKGSTDPLYIIDGVIVSNTSENVINLDADAQQTRLQGGQNRLIDINPNDIERIEVINGAAAAAIYGSLASNGVVQIFTKRGKSGKPKVNVTTSFNVNQLRKPLDLNMHPERFGVPGSPRLATTQDRLTMIADLRSAADRAADPGTGPPGLGGTLVEKKYPVTRYDYQDNIFHTGMGTDNHVSISGGSERTRYYGSFSYMFNEGIIRNTDFQRYGARLRLDQELASWASMSVGLNYTNSTSNDLPNGNNFFSPISTMIIIDNVWDVTERDSEGNLLHVEPVRVNPLSVIEEFKIGQETNRIISDLQFNVFPFKGFNLGYSLGIDAYSLQGNEFRPRLPYPGVAASFFPDGYVSVATSNVFKINHDLRATYQTDITETISSITAVGMSVQYENRVFSSARGRDLTPFINTLAAANNFFSPPAEFRSELSVAGYFLQQTFGIDNTLFLTVAGRLDGSSAFGVDERSQFYPKASASFVLSEMDFWKNGGLAGGWDVFKLRATYGQAGNLTGIGPYDRFSNYLATNLLGRSVIYPSSALGNSGIKPERQTEIEFGADLGFLKNRLGVQFTWYKQEITDLLLDRVLAPSTGGASTVANIGEMTNTGIELMINANPVRGKTFNWDMTIAYNTFNNEVNGIGGGRAGILLRGGGGTQSAIDGQPLGVFYGVYYARNDDGSLLLSPLGLPQVERGNDVTGEVMRENGQPSGTPVRKILGDPNPDWTGSFINQLTYKRLSFRFQFDAVWGFDVWDWNKITLNNVGASPLSERELKGELPRGWVAAVGGFIGPRIQEEHVSDGSFVKLRELALSYDFGKVGAFSGLSVSLIGRNLISFDDYSGYDPETNSAGQNSTVRGDDFGNVPIPRVFQVSLNASF
jgi:TonB-linked SusC/RagA family outer membrane protein